MAEQTFEQQVKSVFETIDSDHDGQITVQELDDFIYFRGGNTSHFKAADINADGVISWEEFLASDLAKKIVE